MADDIASLGFEVDSRELQVGTERLSRLDAEARRVGRSVDDLNTRTGRFGQSLIGMGSGLAAFAASVAGIAGAGGLIGAFITQTIEAENALAQLDAAIKATGGAAGLSSQQLIAMAESLQQVTTFSDDAIISAQGLLLRFDRIGGEVFPRALAAVTDLAAATGKDLNSAVTQVGRSLQDPVRGLQALQRAGIQFTAAQRDQIKTLVESGRGMEAQRRILEVLESRYKGAAAAARDTLGGALQALRNAFDNLFEQTNTQASQDLRASIEQLTAILASPATQSAFQTFGSLVLNQIAATIRVAITEIERLSASVSQFQAGNIGQGFKTLLGVAGEQGTNLAGQLGLEDIDNQMKALKVTVPATTKTMQDFGDTTKKSGQAVSGTNTELEAMLERQRETLAALGSAATVSERYQAQVVELTIKLNDGKISQETFNRAVSQLNPAVQSLQNVVGDLGDSLADAFIHGKDAADALGSALKAVASTASSSALKGLITGLTGGGFDFASIATGGLIGLGASLLSKLFGGGDEDQTAQQQAAIAAAERAEREQALADAQVRAAEFNLRAAEAMEDSTFLRDLMRFDFESQRAFDEESRLAGDIAINQLIAARAAERAKLISDAIDEAMQALTGETLSEVHERMQEIAQASETLAQALEAQGTATDAAIASAQSLARDAIMRLADSTLAAVSPLSEIQQQIAAMTADAAGLINALTTMGLSAEEAAAAINDRLNVALDQLRNDFIDALATQINDLSGGSWINQAQDLADKVAQLRADAAALGIETSMIDTFYVLSAQKIVEQNQLTGDSFLVLERMLGLANTSLHEFEQAITDVAQAAQRSADEINATIQSFQDQLFILQQNQDTLAGQLAVFEREALRARQAEIAKGGQALAALIALQEAQKAKIISDWNKKIAEEQKAALEAEFEAKKKAAEEQKKLWQDAVDFISGIRDRITQFVTGFLTGPQSFLSPQQQMRTGIEAFNKQLTAAKGGDQAALQNITTSAQTALDAIKAYYGSTATGAALQKTILNQLTALPNQLTPEMFIVQATETQTAALQADNAQQLAALTAIQNNVVLSTAANDNVATTTTELSSIAQGQLAAAQGQLAAINTIAQAVPTALLALAEIGSNTVAIANLIPLRLAITDSVLSMIDATLRDGFARMISAIVISSETESGILRLMQADLSTMAKAERRVA
jgi:hypothetical protein